MSENRKFTTKQLVIIAMLVALNVILSRFLSMEHQNRLCLCSCRIRGAVSGPLAGCSGRRIG